MKTSPEVPDVIVHNITADAEDVESPIVEIKKVKRKLVLDFLCLPVEERGLRFLHKCDILSFSSKIHRTN